MDTTLTQPRGAVARHDESWSAPVLQPRDGRIERVAVRLGTGHPVLVFLGTMLTGLALIAAVSTALGFLVTRLLLHVHGVAAADERFVRWLAVHRTPFRTDLSLIGSMGSGGVVLPIVVGATALAFAVMRHWRMAAFVVFVLAVESASYRITTLVVHRQRPQVHRLEDLPVNASYPSGHTAASIAVYCGLALLLTSMIKNRVLRVAAWSVAVLIPVFEALSRMYRGMHHPLDVAGGVVIGIASLCVLVLACRAAGAAATGLAGDRP
jgi:undecaprenyl-diphosphatase